ncbi:hypothetical protein HUU05_06605 [candidate division KSB1 bacterium]|nr:hypothetical protein [candidate division KSB1 bacterium]
MSIDVVVLILTAIGVVWAILWEIYKYFNPIPKPPRNTPIHVPPEKGVDPVIPPPPPTRANTLRVALAQIDDHERNSANLFGEAFVTPQRRMKGALQKLHQEVDAIRIENSNKKILASLDNFTDRTLETLDQIHAKIDPEKKHDSLWQRIEATLRFCRTRDRDAHVIVFPENSIPPRLLPKMNELCQELAKEGQPLLVVAGTHFFEKKEEIESAYKKIGLAPNYQERRAYAPVFVRDEGVESAWRLIPKIAPSNLDEEKGYRWEPSDKGWKPIQFMNRRIAIEIGSDYLSPNHPASFQQKRKLSKTSVPLILVPACDTNFDDFLSQFRPSLSKNCRKTVFANMAEHGHSLTYCTDKKACETILKEDIPFEVGSTVMYRVPPECEAVLINEIRLGDKHGRDELIALAPIICEDDYSNYCRFHQSYKNAVDLAAKTKIIQDYCNAGSIKGDIALARKNRNKVFEEKLCEIDKHNPGFDFTEANLDLLVDIVTIPSQAAITDRIVGIMDGICKAAYVILGEGAYLDKNLKEPLDSLIDIISGEVQKNKVRYPFDEMPDKERREEPRYKASQEEVAEAPKPPAVPPVVVQITLAPEIAWRGALARIIEVLGQAGLFREIKAGLGSEELPSMQDLLDAIMRRSSREPRTGSSLGSEERTALRALGARRLARLVKEAQNSDKATELFEVYEFLKQVEPFLETLVQKPESKAEKPTKKFYSSRDAAASPEEESLKRGFEQRIENMGAVAYHAMSMTLEGLSAGSQRTTRIAIERVDRFWQQFKTDILLSFAKAPALSSSALRELRAQFELMLLENVELAICRLDSDALGNEVNMDDLLLEGGALLEALGRSIFVSALKQKEEGKFEDESLAFIALAATPTIFHGRHARQKLRKILQQALKNRANDEAFFLFQIYLALIERAIADTVAQAQKVLKAMQEPGAELEALEQAASRLLNEAIILHFLLASVDEFVKEHLKPS